MNVTYDIFFAFAFSVPLNKSDLSVYTFSAYKLGRLIAILKFCSNLEKMLVVPNVQVAKLLQT